MSRYKIDKHTKTYIKTELYNYEKNKSKIENIRSNIIDETAYNDGQPRGNETSDTVAKKSDKLLTTRALLIATEKVNNIDRALQKLTEEEQRDVRCIFFRGHNQRYAELYDNISKDMYYNLMDKMIYLTAVEYELI